MSWFATSWFVLVTLGMNFLMIVTASAQSVSLRALDAQEVGGLRKTYEFRVASFSKDEAVQGSGSPILILSHDKKTAIISFNGVRTVLGAIQSNVDEPCVDGASHQQIFAHDQLRLKLKLKMKLDANGCWAQGLISIHVDKYTQRYLVKGMHQSS